MRKRSILLGGALVAGLGLLLSWNALAQQVRVPANETMRQRIAREAKLSVEEADQFLRVLGPAVRDELQKGREVSLAGLGTFRVVRIEAHKDLREGQPVVIPARNTVEFLPEDGVDTAVNADTAEPAETVPEFKFVPLPTQTPGQKTSRTHTPSTRTR